MFGQQDLYIENTSTGQRIPMNRMKCRVCHAAEGTNECGFDEDGGVRRIKHEFGFPEAGVNRNVEEFRERCKIIIETQARTEVRMARIEGVDDIMHGESKSMTKRRSAEMGRPFVCTTFVNRVSKKELSIG